MSSMHCHTAWPVLEVLDEAGEIRRWDDLRTEVIRAALVRCAGNVTEAAKALDVSRSTLCRWIVGEGLSHELGECRRLAGMVRSEIAGPT